MPEALACGTPVLALRQGSVPEVLRDGVTGFIGETAEDLVAAVGRLGEIDRARCRAEAARRFSPRRMVDEYERVYHQLIGRGAAERLWQDVNPLPPDGAPTRPAAKPNPGTDGPQPGDHWALDGPASMLHHASD